LLKSQLKSVTDRFFTLSYHYLRPQLMYESIYDIDFGLLWDDGIRHLIFDVDNTLISYADSDVSIQCINLFKSIQSIGFESILLMSNNSSVDRIERVAKQLDLPAITFACKPFVFTMRRLLNHRSMNIQEVALIGDQLLTDVLLANTFKIISVFVDPIDTNHLSYLKNAQYSFQRWILQSFYRQ